MGDPGLPWNQPAGKERNSTFGKGYNAYASKTAVPSGGAGIKAGAAEKPAFGKAFTVQKASSLDYKEGDRVKHVKFGMGTVKAIKDGGKDFEVTVEFDTFGQKKMFASFAKLIKM